MFIKMRWQETVLRASEYLPTRYEWFLRREKIRLKGVYFSRVAIKINELHGNETALSVWKWLIMAHIESIFNMWWCIVDGDLQFKTLVALKSRNKKYVGRNGVICQKLGTSVPQSITIATCSTGSNALHLWLLIVWGFFGISFIICCSLLQFWRRIKMAASITQLSQFWMEISWEPEVILKNGWGRSFPFYQILIWINMFLNETFVLSVSVLKILGNLHPYLDKAGGEFWKF